MLRRVGEPQWLELGWIERCTVVWRGAVVGVVRVKVGLRPSSRIATVPEVSVVIVVVGGPEKEIKGINDANFFVI